MVAIVGIGASADARTGTVEVAVQNFIYLFFFFDDK